MITSTDGGLLASCLGSSPPPIDAAVSCPDVNTWKQPCRNGSVNASLAPPKNSQKDKFIRPYSLSTTVISQQRNTQLARTHPPFAPYFKSPTMAQSSSTTAPTAPTISAAQQGDNIAHALAGAGGGLLSMTLTSVPPRHSPALCFTDFSCIAIP